VAKKIEAAVDPEIDETPEPKHVPTDPALLALLSKLIEANDAGPVKQIPRGKALIRTPWHPSGEKNRPKLARTTFINNFPCKEIMMSNEEITLLNELKPGKYLGKKVVVIEDSDKEGSSITIYIPNKSHEDKLWQMQVAPELVVLLRSLDAEQKKPVPA
jgi:hypothetical protein